MRGNERGVSRREVLRLGVLGVMGMFVPAFKRAGGPITGASLPAAVPIKDFTSQGAQSVAVSAGSVYFVDAIGGNDSNDGQSMATAWRTIAKVNASSFPPGTSILFNKGGLWREQLTIPSAGASGQPITFGAYGDGNKPKIYGSDVPSSWTLENYTPTPSIVKVQGPPKIGTGNTSVSCTFASTPIQGNLLIACLSCTGSTAGISSAAMSGWTKATSAIEGTGRGFASIWYKVAGANELKTVTATITGGSNACLIIEEWSGLYCPILDQTAKTDDSGAGVTSRSTGTTATTTAANELCIGCVAWGASVTARSWSNSYAAEYGNDAYQISVASKAVSSTGAQETTETWTTARRAGGCIATFKASAPVPLYYTTQSADPLYIWFVATDATIHNGTKVATKDLLGAEYNWWFDSVNSRLYVCAATNPATRYSSVEVSSTTRDRGIMWMEDHHDYHVIDGFEIAFVTGVGIVTRSNSQILNNDVHHIGNTGGHSYGIEINAGSNTLIANNTVHDVVKAGIFIVASWDPYIASNNIVEHNTVYDCGDDLVLVHTEASTTELSGNIIRYNNLYHTSSFVPNSGMGSGIRMFGKPGVTVDATQIYYNLINVKKAGMDLGAYSIGYVSGTLVYNNSVVSSSGKGVSVNGPGSSGNIIKNNIVVDSTVASLKVDAASAVSECDYNCWFSSSGTVYVNLAGVTYGATDFANYKNASGWDSHGLWQDPLVVSKSDLHLQASSPCRGAGVNVGLAQDYAGVAVPSVPDIGAYQYQ